MDKAGWKSTLGKFLGSAACIGIVVSAAVFWYKNYIVTPKLSYKPGEERDTFTVNEDYRNLTLRVYPQMVVRYGDYVVLVTHLDRFYRSETVNFDGQTGCAEKDNAAYADELTAYVYQNVLDELRETVGDDAAKEIGRELNVYVSLLGGVEYENTRGSSGRKHCVIEENGIFTDYSENAAEVRERLCESEITLDERLKRLAKASEVNQMVEACAGKIGDLYIDGAEQR